MGPDNSHHHDHPHHHHGHDESDRHQEQPPARLGPMVSRIAGPLRSIGWRWWVAILMLVYLLSGFYFVSADQQALEVVLGKVYSREQRVQPGLHWTFPYPLARVERVKVLETKRLTVGLEPADQVLGRSMGQTASQFLTGDQNITNITLAVQFSVADPYAYLFRYEEVTVAVARTVETALSRIVVQRKVDDLLTTEKVAVQQEVHNLAQQLLDAYQCGTAISSVSIESSTPPEEVLEAFNDVASAREDRDRIVQEARSYFNDMVPRARGQAAAIIEEANGYCQRKINEAEGDAARFTSLATEYASAKEVTRARLYLETMEEVLPRLKKIIVEPGTIDVDLLERK